MKTPYRSLLGITCGIVAGLLLPLSDPLTQALTLAVEFVYRIGRYVALPLIFFSLPIAVTKMRRQGKLASLLGHGALITILTSAFFALIGVGAAWLLNAVRVPVVPGAAQAPSVPTLSNLFRAMLPENGFEVFQTQASFLLPLVIPAFLLGWHFHHDKEIAEPAYNVFDSLSRIIYRINQYILQLMPLFIAILTTKLVVDVRGIVDLVRFLPMLGILGGITAVLILGIYPIALYFAGGRQTPWGALAGLIGTLFSAVLSGAPLFNYGSLVRHLKENLRIPRHSAALLTPLSLMFTRAGTALVTGFAMMTVIQSYSSLEITLFQAGWCALFSFLISFALPSTLFGGISAALVLLGGLYGRGLDDGWLIMAPVLPFLAMFAVLLDTATTAFVVLLATRKSQCGSDDLPRLNF
ncbi:MAG: cation:dicarboxylase symporter family transporter [Spirochaetales bacterium]|nr:cation:dicarboxylase symporter family transporter [Spirochaetales bacterium]